MQSFWTNKLSETEKCCTKNLKSAIDIFLTNKPLSFHKTRTTETRISDYHKLIWTFLKSYYTRLTRKNIYHGNYKNFNEQLFLKDLENSNLSGSSANPHENSTNFLQTFFKVVWKNALLKQRFSEEIMPFLSTENSGKKIYKRSRLRNKFWKDRSQENELLFETKGNKCVSLRRKCIKSYVQDVTKKGLVTNKSFWNFVKSFLTNKTCHSQNDYIANC